MQRDRLTITLDSELLAAVDSLVDRDLLRNRSQAIEHLLREGIGLHQLRQAFLFFEETYEAAQLEGLLRLCQASGISELYLCLPATASQQLADLQAVAAEIGSFRLTPVPAEFGSGGALLLQKKALETPFLLAWPGLSATLPASLLGAYVFHRQHQAPLTLLLAPEDAGRFQWNGLAIAQPELLQHVPAGIASLREDVFPEVAKAARVRGYVLPLP